MATRLCTRAPSCDSGRSRAPIRSVSYAANFLYKLLHSELKRIMIMITNAGG